jgi:hypothetical protein
VEENKVEDKIEKASIIIIIIIITNIQATSSCGRFVDM